MTSIVATHDIGSAYKIADRIAMIHEGRNPFCGTPPEIRKSHNPYIQQFIRSRREIYYAVQNEEGYGMPFEYQDRSGYFVIPPLPPGAGTNFPGSPHAGQLPGQKPQPDVPKP